MPHRQHVSIGAEHHKIIVEVFVAKAGGQVVGDRKDRVTADLVPHDLAGAYGPDKRTCDDHFERRADPGKYASHQYRIFLATNAQWSISVPYDRSSCGNGLAVACKIE